MKKHVLIATVVSIILAAGAFGVIRRLPQNGRQTEPIKSPPSLREKAKLMGHVTASANPRNLKRYEGIATLTRDSEAVIIGRIDSQTSSLLPPAEKFIFTDFQIDVQQVLKGDVKLGQRITVREPGGRVQFDDGTSAEVELPSYWRNPQVGKTYVLFIDSRPDGRFVLTGGPQGLFEVTPGNTITPQVPAEDKLMQAYNGKSRVAFIADVVNARVQK